MTSKELLKCLKDRPCSVCKFRDENGCHKWTCVFEEETEDEPKKGEWINHPTEFYTPDRLYPIRKTIRECPFCHSKISYDGQMNFCLNCGADMRAKE